ncbi:MAG: class I SAM-dependent methyltransferase [Magnetococcus sp. DMHC-1]|nr:class I SAM-dependent methyltransferase [Magnetococcales bacterium]
MPPLEHHLVWDADTTARLWDFYARHAPFNQQYFALTHGGHLLNLLQRHVSLHKRAILDFGSGPGNLFRHVIARKLDCRYHALDFSEKSIRQLQHDFAGTPQLQSVTAVRELPSSLAAASMDVVIAVEVIEHVTAEQLSAMLTEFKRILKPGGQVVLTTPNKENLADSTTFCPECGAVFHKWQHLRRWDADALREVMTAHGFVNLRVLELNLKYVTADPFGLYGRLRALFNPRHKRPHLVCIGSHA